MNTAENALAHALLTQAQAMVTSYPEKVAHLMTAYNQLVQAAAARAQISKP